MFTIQSLLKAQLATLRPTQMTVGYGEVEKKRRALAKLKRAERRKRMDEQLFPIVIGPAKALYLIDHHHTALALLEEGADQIQAGLVKDLSMLGEAAFWTFLDHYSWMHVYDARGRKRDHRSMPERLQDMKDDRFRSFANDVRDAGGFSKPAEPFQEFLWANFFREAFSAKVIDRDRDKALKKAVELARSSEARHLPGWSGTK